LILVDASVLEHAVTGIGRATLGLYSACLASRPEMGVVAVHQSALTASLPLGMRSVRLAPRLPQPLWRRVALPAFALRQQPAFAHFPWNGGVVRTAAATRTVLTLYDVIPLALPHIYFPFAADEVRYRRRLQRDLDRSDVVITASECSKHDIVRNFRLQRDPVVVHCGLEFATSRQAPLGDGRLDQGFFLYYGGYEARKGLDLLVRTYRRLFANALVEAPLVVAGTPRAFSEAFARDMAAGVREGAILERGYVTDDELGQLLRSARALVYPSRYEGFGYPPLEAMAHGCAVITTRVSSLPEICGDAAFYVPPDDEDSLGRAILQLGANRELRQRLIEKGYSRARLFSWARSAEIFLAALDAAGSRSATRH